MAIANAFLIKDKNRFDASNEGAVRWVSASAPVAKKAQEE
jgi:hypothetical protein